MKLESQIFFNIIQLKVFMKLCCFFNETALHLAVRKNNEEIVKVLLENNNKIDVNITDEILIYEFLLYKVSFI